MVALDPDDPRIPDHLRARMPRTEQEPNPEIVESDSRLHVIIELPQPLRDVSEMLMKVAEIWPEAKTMPNGVDGWTITVRPRDGGS